MFVRHKKFLPAITMTIPILSSCDLRSVSNVNFSASARLQYYSQVFMFHGSVRHYWLPDVNFISKMFQLLNRYLSVPKGKNTKIYCNFLHTMKYLYNLMRTPVKYSICCYEWRWLERFLYSRPVRATFIMGKHCEIMRQNCANYVRRF